MYRVVVRSGNTDRCLKRLGVHFPTEQRAADWLAWYHGIKLDLDERHHLLPNGSFIVIERETKK